MTLKNQQSQNDIKLVSSDNVKIPPMINIHQEQTYSNGQVNPAYTSTEFLNSHNRVLNYLPVAKTKGNTPSLLSYNQINAYNNQS